VNEEFKRLKKWVEKCPVEAAMRIQELEMKYENTGAMFNRSRMKQRIEDLEKENEELKKNLSLLCPIADMPVIESLKAEKLHMMEEVAELEKQKQFYRNRVKYLEDMIDNGLGWDDVKREYGE